MASLSRIGKSRLVQFSQHFKSVSHGSSLLLDNAISRTKPCLAENHYRAIPNNHADFCNGVRFFAAPIQFLKQKKEPTGIRINEAITAEVVRLVIDNEHSIVPRSEALLRAKQLNLDLVEVSSKDNPPVCKIMDYQKDRYEKETKEKERSKGKGETSLRPGAPKEIRFSAKTEKKDLEMKALKVTKLMEDGYKVKCTAKGSDSDALHTLSRLCNLIGDIAVVDSGPTLGKGAAFVVVRHLKYGQKKKGGAKKLKDIADENHGLLVAVPEAEGESDSEIDEQSYSDQVNQGEEKADVHGLDETRNGRYTAEPNTPTSSRAEASGGAQNRHSVRNGATNHFSPAKGADLRNSGTRDGVTNHFSPARPDFRNSGTRGVSNHFSPAKEADFRNSGTRDGVPNRFSPAKPDFRNSGTRDGVTGHFSPARPDFRNSGTGDWVTNHFSPARPDLRNSGTRDEHPMSPESRFSDQGTQPPSDPRENREAATNAHWRREVEAEPRENREHNRYNARRPAAPGTGQRPRWPATR